MVYKTCSVNKVIAQFYRKFKPSHSGWNDDAIEWIGDAIEEMRCHQGYSELFKDYEVSDYRLKIPCTVDSLLGIGYKGGRLRRNGGINHDQALSKYPNCAVTRLAPCNETYYLNPNYINTSFKEGCVTIYYEGLETDCDGYPFVIDDAVYREALVWYVLREMIGRGFKHQTFSYKDADLKWTQTYPRAQNRCKQMDIDQMNNFTKNWLGVIRNVNRPDQFFANDGGSLGEPSFPPGSLLQTFQVIGDNTNNI